VQSQDAEKQQGEQNRRRNGGFPAISSQQIHRFLDRGGRGSHERFRKRGGGEMTEPI
jgi:hypothetical protein